LDTLDAMTMVLSGRNFSVSGKRSGRITSFSTKNAKRIDSSTCRPQSRSGFFSECACLKAKRNGVSSLKLAWSAGSIGAVKLDASPAVAASSRSPRMRLTVSSSRSCAPVPVPLSV
jgi:hypothetical protein